MMIKHLPLTCTGAEYDAATPAQRADWKRRLLAAWSEQHLEREQWDMQADHDEAEAGEIFQ